MDPELVLERNATLAFATLLLMQGAYWLRVAVPFDSSDSTTRPSWWRCASTLRARSIRIAVRS